MSIVYIGDAHPVGWLTGEYEHDAIQQLFGNINSRYTHERNIFINSTWFAPHIQNNSNWDLVQELIDKEIIFDNLFYLVFVDPNWLDKKHFDHIVKGLGNPKVYMIGNVENSPYSFYPFAYIVAKEFKQYDEDDILLRDIRYKFINYNRKPKPFRVSLVELIKEAGLDKYGIVTLGKGENNELIKVTEKVEKVHDDLSNDQDIEGIPNDIMTLGDLNYWNHHFLNVVSETEINPDVDMFLSEKLFKPMIGLRPFIVYGNAETHQFLNDNGFKTFDHWFPFDLRTQDNLDTNIIKTLKWICGLSNEKLQEMYNNMLPDLRHNKERFFEFAALQERRMRDSLSWRM